MAETKKPRFERRHYQILAKVLRETRPEFSKLELRACGPANAQWARVVEAMAEFLARDNLSFRRSAFLEAAGYIPAYPLRSVTSG